MNIDTKILIGTHHKSGTAWMNTIFKALAKEFELRFLKKVNIKQPKDDNWNILLANNSQFDFSYCEDISYKGIHLIRDPRDIIVSGTFYHCKSQEKWLHKKHSKYDGLTYQEKLNSYESFDDKMAFEIENSSVITLNEIANWQYNNPIFFELKYEELVADNELKLFLKMFRFLGFTEGQIPKCLDLAYKNSLFSGKVKKSIHVRSGKSQQWKLYFKPFHKKRFLELYGDLLVDLGYEPNNDWAY